VVLSGKGGVGKSTVAVNLALGLARAGKKTGLLDVDIHGPSVPRMLALGDVPVSCDESSLFPVNARGLKVMSIGFLLRGRDEAVIWRGPMKAGAIMQFLRDVEWGELDYLVVDCPPGTGDEPLTVLHLLTPPVGAVLVTTPQQVAVQEVRRSVVFCRQLKIPVLGVVENMSGFVCPHCKKRTDIFSSEGGQRMAEEMGVPFLGAVPLDPAVMLGGESGSPIIAGDSEGETSRAFGKIISKLVESLS